MPLTLFKRRLISFATEKSETLIVISAGIGIVVVTVDITKTFSLLGNRCKINKQLSILQTFNTFFSF